MPTRFTRFVSRWRWSFLSLVLIVPLGFCTKVYYGPAYVWVHNSLGGVLYVIFWSLLFSFIFIRSAPWKIAGIVMLATCSLEFLQLWHPSFLETLRSTFIGAILLGNSFSWSDLAHYAIGFLLSWGLLHILGRRRLMIR
jgi:hypothetical protein